MPQSAVYSFVASRCHPTFFVEESNMAAVATTTDTTSGRRRLTGVVVSNKMQKSATVRVERLVKHARYHKYIRRCKTYIVHDEDNSVNPGDKVEIEESRPISRRKRWVIVGKNVA
jgi:small subunit ribosomal protein S17